MWLAGTNPSSTFGSTGVRMDRPARMFLCAMCRVQVVLCSRCDRGNRYCGRACWHQARDMARRAAASRYQRSRRGRFAHAERSRRWRARRAAGGDGEIACQAGGRDENVTHQGWLAAVVFAPLGACTPPNTPSDQGPDTSVPDTQPETAPTTAATSTTPHWYCRRCARQQPALLRQGFIRHVLRRTVSMGPRHDHSP